MCGAPAQDLSLEGIDVATETVIQGTVTRDGQPEGGAYVRLLDSSGEFTAEVVTSATGAFRFFARPGSWTLRALASGDATADAKVEATQGEVTETSIALWRSGQSTGRRHPQHRWRPAARGFRRPAWADAPSPCGRRRPRRR